MKRVFRKTLLLSIFSLFSLSFISPSMKNANNGFKEITNIRKAPQSLTIPSLTNDYGSKDGFRRSWENSSDPTAGANVDPAIYSTSINSGTTGSTQLMPFTLNTGTTGKFSLSASSQTKFVATYIPFHILVYPQGVQKRTYYATVSLEAYRNASDGNPDYSMELFYFGESEIMPENFFYHRNDFASNTNKAYSKYRLASDIRSSTQSHDVTFSFVVESTPSSPAAIPIYMGLFVYIEQSGTSGNFRGDMTFKSFSMEAVNAIATVNGGNAYTAADIQSKFNATSSSTLNVLSSFEAEQNIVLTSDGTISIGSNTITMGNYSLYLRGDIAIDGRGTITGSQAAGVVVADGGTISDDAAVNISDNVNVVSTSNDANGKAILVNNTYAKVFIGPNVTVTSSHHGVLLQYGELYVQGRIIAGNTSYAIMCYQSWDYHNNIYLYGSSVRVDKILIFHASKTNIYAKYEDTPYSSTNPVSISVGHDDDLDVGFTIVTDINGSNYSKFRLVCSDATLTLGKDGNDLITVNKDFNVTYDLTNCSLEGEQVDTASANFFFEFVLVPSASYGLPNTIAITVAGVALVLDDGYTYNSETGEVSIDKFHIAGNIKITATGVILRTVTFLYPDGSVAHDPINVKNGDSLTLPYPDTTPDYKSIVRWYGNNELTGDYVAAGSNKTITSNTTLYVGFSRTDADYVDEFVGVALHFDVDVIDIDNEADTNACRDSGDGAMSYYDTAKTAYSALSDDQKELFCTNSAYANAKARFNAWANANGERLNFETYEIVPKAASYNFNIQNNNSDGLIGVIFVSITTIFVLSFGYFVFKKKRD